MSPRHPSRAFVAALLLLVQGLGLAHLAVETHTVGRDGAMHDVAQLLADTHDSNDPHLCAPEEDGHLAPGSTGCAVLASWRAALEAPASSPLHPGGASQPAPVTPHRTPAAQQDVLSRAPKLSPPAA